MKFCCADHTLENGFLGLEFGDEVLTHLVFDRTGAITGFLQFCECGGFHPFTIARGVLVRLYVRSG
jgi:hypothetical protein